MQSWNQNIKKILDFIPHFEKMRDEMRAQAAKKQPDYKGDIEAVNRLVKALQDKKPLDFSDDVKAIRAELLKLSSAIAELGKVDHSAFKVAIESKITELSKEIEQKIDSTRRTYSELNEQAYQLAVDEFKKAIPKPTEKFDDSKLIELIKAQGSQIWHKQQA